MIRIKSKSIIAIKTNMEGGACRLEGEVNTNSLYAESILLYLDLENNMLDVIEV